MVEENGVLREAELRRGFDEGVEEERVRARNREEEAARVENRAGFAGQSEKLGEEGAAAVRAGHDEVGVDLLQRFDPRTGSEKSEVGRRTSGLNRRLRDRAGAVRLP